MDETEMNSSDSDDSNMVNEIDLIKILNIEWTKNMNFVNYTHELASYGVFNPILIDLACIEVKKKHTENVIAILKKQITMINNNTFTKTTLISELRRISTQWHEQFRELKAYIHNYSANEPCSLINDLILTD